MLALGALQHGELLLPLYRHLLRLLALLRIRLLNRLRLLLGLGLGLLALLALLALALALLRMLLLLLIWSLFVGISHSRLRPHLLWRTLLTLRGRLALITLLRVCLLHCQLLGHLMLLLLSLRLC